MTQIKLFPTAIGLTLLIAGVLAAQEARAQMYYPAPSPGGIPNAYVAPHSQVGVGTALYPCPRPAPPMVGYTYIPYEPLAPHEFLYGHHCTYVRKNDGHCSTTRTSVTYWHRGAICPFTPSKEWELPRGNRPVGMVSPHP